LVLPLNQRWPPPLRLQFSHCSTFRIVWRTKYSCLMQSIECLLLLLLLLLTAAVVVIVLVG
jgi:hypothetical protein